MKSYAFTVPGNPVRKARPAKSRKTSPLQRSLRVLRADGWLCAITEHWNPHARIRQDLFNIADILAVKTGRRPLLVQTTSAANVAARVTKIRESPHLATLVAVFDLQVDGWARPTRRIRVWRQRVVPITSELDRDVWDGPESLPAGKDLGVGPP